MENPKAEYGWKPGAVVNVGGGTTVSLSLRETSALCEEITGNRLAVAGSPATHDGDVRIYISDTRALGHWSDWVPHRQPREILTDIFTWVNEHERQLAAGLE